MERHAEMFSPLKEMLQTRRFGRMSLIAVILIFLAVVSAGCIVWAEPVQTQSVEVSEDMDTAMNDFISDLKNIDLSLTIDIYTLASKIGSLDTYSEIESVGREYYSQNSWIDRIIYYDAGRGNFINIPNQYLGSLTDYVIPPSEQEFLESGGLIRSSCVYIDGDGYMEIWYAAAYDDSGRYAGYVAFVYDWYEALKEHEIVGKEVSYGDCIVYLCSNSNAIIYSSKPEYTGQTFSPEKPLKTKETIIVSQDDNHGAYTYTSQSFYVYNQSIDTHKITSWQKFPFHDMQYVIYLTKEIDSPALNYSDIFTPDMGALKKDLFDTFVYSANYGYPALEKRITEGYYPTRMYAMDQDGTVLAVPEYDEMLAGLSFLNARDSYDSAYVEKAMYVAQQGGGYIKYLFPVDGTVHPEASQFSLSYVEPIENGRFIFGYTPGDTKLWPVNQELKSNVVLVSRALVETAYKQGVEKLSEIVMSTPNASGSVFVHGTEYALDNIIVMDYNGYSYADTRNPSLVGQSMTFYTDVLQTSITRTAIMLAKSGGGVMYDFQETADKEGHYDLWLYSVEPINNDYFVLYGTVVHTVENVTILDG
ncbi:MAG: hypothetical protein O0W99_07285 [Methanocorpusculum sp.]|uniref:Uncharacterized protein n=2 Tax=Methanocorpusculum vombati TaxID=3002864 RepID=A0ABT4IJT8_9EURY|nr:hypothetical protein [Methanocorpusculum vombati]MDE2520405.1 hypothetical protein [Methanocorpusculum sp.]MDE2534074.1 hypothetical protein [Methanocorpusculum sp.]MDE2546583.1 hypothetical protein [Methanocorpusculum sp.]MDE2547875.1 hypothetical protein [Methanocorpusculum sp.]